MPFIHITSVMFSLAKLFIATCCVCWTLLQFSGLSMYLISACQNSYCVHLISYICVLMLEFSNTNSFYTTIVTQSLLYNFDFGAQELSSTAPKMCVQLIKWQMFILLFHCIHFTFQWQFQCQCLVIKKLTLSAPS